MAERWDRTRWLIFGIVALGIAIRLVVYLHNRGFWQDEASLALNIVNMSYGQLLGRLNNDQVAPPLFLLLSKLMCKFFGQSEYSLRLIPLISGCATLCLLARLTLRLVPRFFSLCIISIYALGFSHIDYATNFKQYASDELSAMLVLCVAFSWVRLSTGFRYVAAAMLPALLWLSYTSGFVLAGLVVVAGLSALKDRSAQKIRATILLLLSMSIAAISVYAAAARNSIGHDTMTRYWVAAGGFPTRPFTGWPLRNIIEMFGAAVGVTRGPAFALSVNLHDVLAATLAFGICLWGACHLAKSDSSSISIASAATIFSATIASLLHIYPLVGGRLTAYSVPIALVLLGAGFDGAHRALVKRRAGWIAPGLAVALVAIVVIGLCISGSHLFVRQEIRDVARELFRRTDGNAPILVDPPGHNIFRLYGGPLLRHRVVWLDGCVSPVNVVHRGWIEAGRPPRFWVIITDLCDSTVSPLQTGLEPFCRVVDVILKGHSGAILLEIRPLR